MADASDTQRVRWLTTEQVMSGYGFDPRPYLTDRDPRIKSKLHPVNVAGVGNVTVRVWLADAVESHPAAVVED